MIRQTWHALRAVASVFRPEKHSRFRHGQAVIVRDLGPGTVVADDGHTVEVLIDHSLENVLVQRGEVRAR
jgi:hypothetical protein